MPEIPNIGRLLEQARRQFRKESWVAPQPSAILRLVSDKNRRLVRDADELLMVIIDTLEMIEKKYTGSATMKNSLWNDQSDGKVTPKNEEALSDAIAEWLREQLHKRIVTVNREPQVRLIPGSPDRTDIQVESFTETDESLMVIIEVKGCWNRGLFPNMQSQLVDQYIKNNDRCSHGLYLIGYYRSDKWDEQEKNAKKCRKYSKDQLEKLLEQKQQNLVCDKQIRIKTYVFDAWRNDGRTICAVGSKD
jgi:hypothetical protein